MLEVGDVEVEALLQGEALLQEGVLHQDEVRLKGGVRNFPVTAVQNSIFVYYSIKFCGISHTFARFPSKARRRF